MKLTSEEARRILEKARLEVKDNKWIDHCICVGNTAGKIAKALNEKGYNVDVDKTITTSIQNIIKEQEENNELLATVGQMSLCFTEVVVFSILAILSSIIGEKVFMIIFGLSIISTLWINYSIKRESIKKCE